MGYAIVGVVLVPAMVLCSMARGEVVIPLSDGDGAAKVVRHSADQFEVEYAFTSIECSEVQTERGTMIALSIPGVGHSHRLGSPKLPVGRRLIATPLGAEVSVEVLECATQELDLGAHGVRFPIVPAQPPIPKHLRPDDIPFAFDPEAYETPGYGNRPAASVEDVGTLRGLRVSLLVVEPVRYDPRAGRVLVCERLRIRVSFNGADHPATEHLREATWSPYFESLYRRTLLNYQPPFRFDDLTRYPVKYLIVSDPMFASQLQPFIQWKTMKGFDVMVGYVGDADVGSSTASIKSFIRTAFESATPSDPAPSFVLFVGDVAQVPTWQGTTDQHVTDLHYVTLAGNDMLPEMYFGRFSANTQAELQPQIDKTLEYERLQMADPSYLGEAVMIAGMDPNFSQTWANGQVNYGTTYYFNDAHGITSHTYLYPESGSHGADIIADISRGVCYANYTAHGWEQGWADPGFEIGDIQGLQNAHRYGLMVGNACLTNRFNIPTCFGEAWLRAENKGAVGYIGGTNSTLWNEDFWWGVGAGTVTQFPTYEATGPGAYDGMFHDHGEPFSDWFTTQYAIIMAGCLAVVESGSPEDDYYWEIYALMGDPSLATWFGVPTANTVVHAGFLAIGDTSLSIAADPWSYAALSRNGVLLTTGLIDDTGQAVLRFDPITSVDPLDLVVTRQNRIPVVQTITVNPSLGPWVTASAVEIDDTQGGNGNGQADFGETLLLTLTAHNVGYETAFGVSLLIASGDSLLAIEDSTEYYGDIAAGEESAVEHGFQVVVAGNVPDGRVISVDVQATDSQGHSWPSRLDILVHAPGLALTEVIVCDQDNAALDPGETAGLEVRIRNTGSASAYDLVAALSTADPFITLIAAADSIAAVAPGDSADVSFVVQTSETTPPGHTVVFEVSLAGLDYAMTDSFSLRVGRIVEDFETGDFSAHPWVMGGNAPWMVSSTNPYEGSHAAVSSDIGNSQSAAMMLVLSVREDGVISFRYRVSSEPGYDFFRFSIDGNTLVQASGNVTWTEATCAVSSGTHTFTWNFSKDQSVSVGMDCAWVDYIIFPALAESVSVPDIEVTPRAVEVTVSSQPHTEHITIANLGDADLAYSIQVSARGPETRCRSPLKLAKGEDDPRSAPPVTKGWGGPDGHGYRWIDSDEPGGPVYGWIDISAVGTCPGTSDDGNYGPFDLGFVFPFYGEEYTTVHLCTNGWLSFTSAATAFENQDLPCPAEPNAVVAPLWSDLDPSSGGRVRYHSDPGAGQFIAQWDNVPLYSDTPDTVTCTFQAVLRADGRILYQYAQLPEPVGAHTVGMEDCQGTDALQIVFNQSYLHDSLAILIEPGEPWLSVVPSEGTVPPNGTQTVSVTCSPAGLPEGAYEGTIAVWSNDPDEPSVSISVNMQVTPVSADGLPMPVDLALEAVPNPFSTACRFGTGVSGIGPDEVRVYDLRGGLVWRWMEPPQGGGMSVWVPAPSVGSGMYAVHATVGDRRVVGRIVYLK